MPKKKTYFCSRCGVFVTQQEVVVREGAPGRPLVHDLCGSPVIAFGLSYRDAFQHGYQRAMDDIQMYARAHLPLSYFEKAIRDHASDQRTGKEARP